MGQQSQSNVQPDIIRTVNSLLSEQFFVPGYQRGYRWKKQQVTDLLKDINDFEPVTYENKLKSWYCLQPLVVRKNGGKWNLIDGQQRLTTIYLILHFLREGLSEQRKQDWKFYSLEYETRKNEADWPAVLDDGAKAEANIDFWHIHDAYQTIKQWFRNNNVEDKFRGKLSEDCKFIWYDIDQTGTGATPEEDVFIRLNIGKIPLTNAELIKALFLNSSNFTGNSKDEVCLRQIEIAAQWDLMEEELSDDAFWYFINGKENKTCPRINYLFEIISGKKVTDEDSYAAFRCFQERFVSSDSNREQPKKLLVDSEWENIYTKYQVLREWFKDRFYYHHIGFLLTSNESINSLLNDYTNPNQTKPVFHKTITNKIRSLIKWNGVEEIEKYDGRCKKILLLHNIITMQQHENDSSRFPFDKYHKENWDIEHIQAVADPEKKPVQVKDRRQYLEDSREFVDDALKSEITAFINDEEKLGNAGEFDALYGKIVNYFEEGAVESAEINTLSNLALLDARTNRGYGNAVFPIKRKTILQKDADGQFIPVCTKNAFLKYYSAGELNRWFQKDREAYYADIKAKLKDFFKGDKK